MGGIRGLGCGCQREPSGIGQAADDRGASPWGRDTGELGWGQDAWCLASRGLTYSEDPSDIRKVAGAGGTGDDSFVDAGRGVVGSKMRKLSLKSRGHEGENLAG